MAAIQLKDETAEAAAARAALMQHLAASGEITDRAVLDALARIPRHEFVEEHTPLELAYRDRPLPIGHQQTISQPYVVALMTQALSLTGRERVLEVGTGSGYQAAVLSLLSRHVDSMEIIPELARQAQARLARLGLDNVVVHLGDGYRGCPAGAPFDRIILTAAPPEIPQALLEQLADGGILVAPVGPVPSRMHPEDQRLVRWQKRGQEIVRQELGPVRFVPMVPSR